MSNQIELDAVPDALRVAIGVLAAQAFALDRLFYRASKEAFSVVAKSHYHVRKALKAQARGLATFKILLALRAVTGPAEKIANSNEGTIQEQKTPYITNDLSNDEPSAAVPAQPRRGRRGLGPAKRARKGWSPQRRARQAEAIRTWQPWKKSTGPRTDEGKVRSASNALKHGCRSRPYIERRREDRRILRLSAANIAAGKAVLRAVAAKREPNSRLSGANGLHLALSLSPNWYWPSSVRAGTVSPTIYPGIARTRGPAGALGGSL